MSNDLLRHAALALVPTLALAGAAGAGVVNPYSTVNAPPGAEKSHLQILQSIYNTGTWSPVGSGPDFSNGAVSAVRLADFSPIPVTLPAGLPGPTGLDDSLWGGAGPLTLVAKAKHAGDTSVFGYLQGSAGGGEQDFVPLFNTSSFNTPAAMLASGDFRWALKDLSTGRLFTSRPGDNFGAGNRSAETFDQLVTYQLSTPTTPSALAEYVLFWEDRVHGQPADYDYNDAAIVVTVVSSPAVPAPATAGVLTLGAAAALRRRRAR